MLCAQTSDKSRIHAFPVRGVNHTKEAEEKREPDDGTSRHDGGDLSDVLGGEPLVRPQFCFARAVDYSHRFLFLSLSSTQ